MGSALSEPLLIGFMRRYNACALASPPSLPCRLLVSAGTQLLIAVDMFGPPAGGAYQLALELTVKLVACRATWAGQFHSVH